MNLSRILHLDSGVAWRGGQRQVFLLIREQRQRGFQPELAAPPGGRLFTLAAELGVTCHPLSIANVFDRSARKKLSALLRGGFDILHAHDGHSHAVALAAVGDSGPPLVVTRRVAFPPHRDPLTRRRFLSPRLTRLVGVSEFITRRMAGYGIPAERLTTIHSAAEPPSPVDRTAVRKNLAAEHDLPADALWVGVIGALSRRDKGQGVLIEAWCAVDRRHRLLLIGEGPDRRRFEHKIQRCGLGERVVLTGFIPEAERVLPALDLLAVPSLSEGLGGVIIDAFLAGVPVVASDVGGVPELVRDGETGLLVPPGDPAALAAALGRMLADDDLRRRCAEKARLLAGDEFCVPRMADRYESLYRTILDRAPGD
jgi:glycosyltransferase involved in cell wall biosynthesis